MPPQTSSRLHDGGATPLGVALALLSENDGDVFIGDRHHQLRPLQDAAFVGVADVENLTVGVLREHRPHQPVDGVTHVAEAAGLVPVAVNLKGDSVQNTPDELRDHAPIIKVIPNAKCIEYAHDPHVKAIATFVLEGEGFSKSFTFVVTRPDARRIDIAEIRFGLGMDQRVAVALGR